MPSTGATRAQARQRRARATAEKAEVAAERDGLRAEVELLKRDRDAQIEDRDATIERLTEALAQVSAERAGDGVATRPATGLPEPGPLARALDRLDLGSCDQCARLAYWVRQLDERVAWDQRALDAEKRAHAATRGQHARELAQRDAQVGKLEARIRRLRDPLGLGI